VMQALPALSLTALSVAFSGHIRQEVYRALTLAGGTGLIVGSTYSALEAHGNNNAVGAIMSIAFLALNTLFTRNEWKEIQKMGGVQKVVGAACQSVWQSICALVTKKETAPREGNLAPRPLPPEAGLSIPAEPREKYQDYEQIYTGREAEGYGGFGECDANVYGWARWKLNPGMIGGKTVLDAGCGKGPFIEHCEAQGAAKVIGVEASPEMIAGIPHSPDQALIEWPADPQTIQTLLARHRRLIIQGLLQDVLVTGHIQADVALSFFNIVCFPDPLEPTAAMAHAVRPGGKLVVISNVFVPSDLPLEWNNPGGSAMDINDLHHPYLNRYPMPDDLVFRQVLHLRGKDGEPFDLPIQDHVHTLGAFSEALKKGWKVEQATVAPPQLCTLVDPRNPGRFAGMHDTGFAQDHPIYSPSQDGRLQYAKLCLIAERA
jgi:SAM-dependent methyltransferase